MNKTLDELNADEVIIMDKVSSIYKAGGTIEEKTEKLYEAGIFSKYNEVHKSYIEIIRTGTELEKQDALKRALFIQWIGSFEPAFITGISTDYQFWEPVCEGLELKNIAFVYSEIDSLIKADSLDEEIKAMLSYYAIWDYVFQFGPFLQFENLQKFIKEHSNDDANHIQKVREFNLENRGQMGKYWLSLNLSSI